MCKSSKKNIVADTMVEDDSESYNLINIHTPTANIGLTVFICLVGVVCLFRLYTYMRRSRCARAKAGAGGRRPPAQRDTATVDMDSHTGHTLPAQGVPVFGGEARSAYWTPREDPCRTCLEEAWMDHGHRRAKARFGLSGLVGASDPKSVHGVSGLEDAWVDHGHRRARWPGGEGESPPQRKRTRARSVESF